MKEKASQRLNSNYLEDYDDDDENAVSLLAIKKQHKQNITDIKRMFAFLDEGFLSLASCCMRLSELGSFQFYIADR